MRPCNQNGCRKKLQNWNKPVRERVHHVIMCLYSNGRDDIHDVTPAVLRVKSSLYSDGRDDINDVTPAVLKVKSRLHKQRHKLLL